MSGAPDLEGLSREQVLALLGQPSPAPAPIPVDVQALPPIQGVNSHGQPLAGPDYNQGALPDRAETLALLANSDPAMSGAEDAGRSVVSGLERGVVGLPSMPGDLSDAVGHGTEWLLHHGYGALQDWTGSNLGVPYMGKNNTHFGEGVAPINYAHLHGFASHADLDQAAQNALGPYHTPQTTPGRYAERIGEFAPMVAAPGGIVARLANVIAPAVASQAAQDVAPQQYKGAASLAGALLGGGVVGSASRLTRAPEAALGGAMDGVTAAQMQAAQGLRVQAAQRGIQLTIPEAVQQVTNNATGLGRLQHVIENSAQGKGLTAPYFSQRPAQVEGAVTQLADAIAPPTAQPSMIGVRGQQVAVTALDRARQTVNSVARPDYEALRGQPVDIEPQAQLVAQPSYQIALRQLRADPELGPTIAGLPDNSVAVVNAVKQRLGTMGEQAKGSPLAPGDNQLAGVRFGAKALADQLAREASPQYASANDTVADLSQRYVEPLKAGPLGAMSQSAEVPAQTGALYPQSPLAGAPDETQAAIALLGQHAPGVAEDLTRQHILNNLDSAMRSLHGGQNQYAGAKLAVALAGSPEQAATLRAGLSALPNGVEHTGNMDELLQALQATGKRQPPGSMTAFNAEALNNLRIAPSAQAIGRLTDPLEWGKALGDVINRANYRRNVSKLAEMIMADPQETTAVLTKAQKASKRSASPMLPALLAAGGSR